MSDEDYERLFRIKGQPVPSAFLSLPDTWPRKAASATSRAGATTMAPFRRRKEGEEPEAKRLYTRVQDGETEVSSREEGTSKEGALRPEKARLSSEHFEAGIYNAEASPEMPEEPLIIPEMSRQLDKQSDTSRHQTEPQTNRATPEIQDNEKQLREKERHLQIREAELHDVGKVLREKERDVQVREEHVQVREADVQDGEKVLRVKERDLQIRGAEVEEVEKVLRMTERDLQIREAEVQKMLQAANERREVRGLQEDNLRQRLAAMKEENLRLREAALTQQTTVARQPNDAARGSDVFSLSSCSSIRNSPRVRSNVDLFPQNSARLKQDSRYHGNELVSPASTARDGPSMHTNIGLSSSKSHARLKEASEYYSNE